MSKPSRLAVIFFTHIWNPTIGARVEKLLREKPQWADVFVMADQTTGRLTADDMPAGVGFFGFKHSVRARFKKGCERFPSFFPGNTDTGMLSFHAAHPDYAWYLIVENDVVFTGDWQVFFEVLAGTEADFMATNISRRSDIDWALWSTLRAPVALDAAETLRAFMPVCRFSNRAFEVLREEYKRGWAGHFETTVPTVLNLKGLTIEDFGGDGPFVPEGAINRLYTSTPQSGDLSPGSFVWRPSREVAGDRPDTLWHPVKWPDAGDWETRPTGSLMWRMRRRYWTLRRRLSRSRGQ